MSQSTELLVAELRLELAQYKEMVERVGGRAEEAGKHLVSAMVALVRANMRLVGSGQEPELVKWKEQRNVSESNQTRAEISRSRLTNGETHNEQGRECSGWRWTGELGICSNDSSGSRCS